MEIATIHTVALRLDSSQVATFESSVYIKDNSKFLAGTGNDLQIYHDGSNSYIDDAGTGELRLRSSGAAIMSASGAEYLAYFAGTGSQVVSLYAGGVLQAGTMSDGWKGPATKGVYFDGGSPTSIEAISADRLGIHSSGKFNIELGNNGEA